MEKLGREGSDLRMCGIFYLVVVQLIILYGLEIWVMNMPMLTTLDGAHLKRPRISYEVMLIH